jgi:hypothetical protein
MRYSVDKSCVTHDRLGDEVIIINVGTGSYYSGSGPAADIWSLFVQGTSLAEATSKLASEYSCDEHDILRDVDRCVGYLLDRGLLRQSDHTAPAQADLALPQSVRTGWNVPDFDEYTDMWDLIKLDPIHEADDVGWPIAKP